jgi:hypothetical protein
MAESVAAGDVDEDPWGLRDTMPGQLPGVEPAERASAPAHAVAPPSGSTPVDADLERLLARHTPIAWFEAVAVVQELCGALVERGTNVEGSVPGLGEIAISPGGGLTLLAEGPPAPSPVSSVAHILMALLSEAETLPVQLRLLALGAASPTPRFKSIAELSNGLAFFERPGRRAHLQALYDRFQETPVSKAETEPTPAPPRPLVRPPRPPRLRWWTPRRIRAGVAVAAVALAVGTAVWLWPRIGGRDATGRRGPVASALAGASQKMARVAEDGVRAVARTLGLAATDRPGVVSAAEPVPADAGAGAAGARVGRPQTAQPAAAGEGGGAPSEAAPALADAAVYSARDPSVMPPRLDRSRLPASPPPAASWTEVPDDTNVTPPRLDRARLPAYPPPGVNLDEVPEIDLVVSATGEVESVRLLTQPVRVPAAMMLSAVKNWRFEPATRGGQPVRYRMRLRLTNQ